MLKFFRGNQPLAVLYLAPLCALSAWLAIRMESAPTQPWGPVLDIARLPYPLIGPMIAGFVVLVNGMSINRIFNQHGFHERTSYLNLALFVVLLCIWPTGLYLTREVLGALLLILIIAQLLRIEPNEEAPRAMYNAGLGLGLLTLLFPAMVILLPFLWLALSGSKSMSLRELALPVLGVLTPWAYVVATHLIREDFTTWVGTLPESFHINFARLPKDMLMKLFFISFAVMTVMFYWSTLVQMSHSSLKFRRIMRVILRMSIGMLIYLGLFSGKDLIRQTIVILPLITVVASCFSLSRKSGILTDLFVLVLFILSGLIAWQYF